MKWNLDTATGHILCVLLIFATGVCLYLKGMDYGKEVMAGALGSLWTLLQVGRVGMTNVHPGVVNQAETIQLREKDPPA